MSALNEGQLIFTGMTFISVLFMLVGMVLIADNHTVSRRARLTFLLCLAALIPITLADWFNDVYGPLYPGLRAVHVTSMVFTFSLAPLFPVAIARTVFPSSRKRWIMVVLAAHALIELATAFGGFVFWVDANNVYHRGPCYFVYMIVYTLSAIVLAYESIKAGHTYQSANIVSILSILGFLIVGVGIQVVDSRIRTTWPAVGMVMVLYFMFYSEMVLRTDALTRLLNRHSYEEFLARPTLPCTVVLIDVDSFKNVNDTHGHAFGDVCLQTIAGLIRQAYGSAGLCYRTGGDEFTVMVTKHQAETRAMADRLSSLIAKAQAKDERIPTVSVGMALAAADTANLQDVINAADNNMYAAKRLRKETANR